MEEDIKIVEEIISHKNDIDLYLGYEFERPYTTRFRVIATKLFENGFYRIWR